MTAAYRLKGIGWFAGCVAFVLGFYLVSLQVAAERKTLDDVNARIHAADRDIRALETEFDTRANLVQLEKWNGDTLALAAPTAEQYLPDEAALARFDVTQGGGAVQTASLVVPALATPVPATPQATIAPAAIQAAAAMPAARPAVIQTAAVEKSAPVIARQIDAARGAAAVARVRPQAVAMLDRKLLSDTTLGDILSGARAEAGRRR